MVVTIVSVGVVYMKKYKCPVCGEETISILKKANLSVTFPFRCNKCDALYGPPYVYSVLLIIAVGLGYYAVLASNLSAIIKIISLLLLIAIHFFVNVVFMPIVKR
jgi:predicted RNA-binding Zn-ribbon protein involved in translation (DUF1610 family)